MPKPAKEHVPSIIKSNRRKCQPAKLNVAKKHSVLEKDNLKWSINKEITAEILEGMGVSALEEVSCDKVYKDDPTPESRVPSCRSAPKIPRCTTNSAVADNLSGSPSFSGASTNFAVFRKCKIEENTGEDPFVKLSDEIILHIFKWLHKSTLSRCAVVCKRWKSLSYDETLWRRVDLSKKYVETDVLQNVLERGVVILRLAISNIKHCPLSAACNLSSKLENKQRFSKLRFLDLSMACISSEILSDLLSLCSQLKKISLEHCPLDSSICGHLGENPNLEVINMSMCHGLVPDGIYAVASNCLRLQSWNLAWTKMSVECMNVLSQCVPSSLKKLNISGHREVLNDNHVAKIAERCPNLVEFDISDSTQLTAITFEVLIHSLSQLEALHASRCYNILVDAYFELVHVKSLQCLTVYGMMNETLVGALRQKLLGVEVNKELFSTVSRPTTGVRRTSIWGLRVRD